MRIFTAIACLLTLNACMEAEISDLNASFAALETALTSDPTIDVPSRDIPFDTGTVYVVANEHGDLHIYTLTPCRGGTHICGGSGHVGRVSQTSEFFVVTGAYRDRTFYLSPGGDGYLTWRGVNRDLAWN